MHCHPYTERHCVDPTTMHDCPQASNTLARHVIEAKLPLAEWPAIRDMLEYFANNKIPLADDNVQVLGKRRASYQGDWLKKGRAWGR